MQSLWMIVASFLFACMGVCVKLAAASHSAVEITFWRSFLSLLLMFALVRLRGVPLRTPHWRWHVSRGVVGFVALFAYFYAITLLPLATAVTLNYTSAIFLALYLALAGWRMRTGMLGALAVGLAGVVLLLRPTFHAEQLFGGLVGLASGVLAAGAYFSVRELGARGEPETRTVFYFALVSTVCAGVWLVFDEMRPVDRDSGLLLLGVAGFATFAQLAMTRAYSRGKTLMSAALAYSTVIFSSLAGVLFWGEVLPASAWAAIGLIVLSGIAATHFSRASPVAQD
ncbi:S-adenosylmethionine uptake transporter [Azonexus fungiphilus]|uniref:S-adenosylmethionine uptake transporter n=1 Tax=Azonexus fungiphilus TaxID=146940 RepID=A0A495WDP2_9RHOO|nr:DMT family transporter [Azonexus fungiphilus]NHC06013.1 DMT family transporter [Azonexus fungiphilus]RKT59340.1 S-adenosylmethionine uptake transporter [Azonexus fungiphilus]